jgi:Domain of unknown function (DUF1707)
MERCVPDEIQRGALIFSQGRSQADNVWVDPQTFDAKPLLRASDADRDRAASVLNDALAEGRLTAQEHSERLDSTYAAKTQAELVPLIQDLPAPGEAPAVVPAAAPAQAHRGNRIVAVFAGASRRGTWRVPAASSVVTVFGGADLDLRDAVLPAREIDIRVVTVFGGAMITIPPDMRVVDSGVAVLGGRDVPDDGEEPIPGDAPVLRLHGACVFGGISVIRRPRDDHAKRPELPKLQK